MTHERAIDFAPLREPVDRWDAQYLVDQVKAQPAYGHWRLTRSTLGWAIAALIVLLAGWIALLVAFTAAGRPWAPGEILLFAAALALVLVLYLTLATSAVSGMLAGSRVRALARVIRFANRNALQYEPIAPNREYPGARFAGLYLRDRLADSGGCFDYGQRLRPGKHGAHAGTSLGWYVAIALERSLPHMIAVPVRDATVPARDASVLAVESLRVTCAPEAEGDARSLFTPALASALAERRCEAEVAGRWLLLFPGERASVAAYGDEGLHRRMLQLVAAAGSSPLVHPTGLREGAVDAEPRHAARRPLVIAGLLVATVLPVAAATVPFCGGIAAAVSMTLG